jgi:hypothetical protein
VVGLLVDQAREDGDRVVPLVEAHDGERASAEVDAAVRVDEVKLRPGDSDDGLLCGGRWRCCILFDRLGEEVLCELVGVDGGVEGVARGSAGGGGGCGEERGVEIRVGLVHIRVKALFGIRGSESHGCVAGRLRLACCGSSRERGSGETEMGEVGFYYGKSEVVKATVAVALRDAETFARRPSAGWYRFSNRTTHGGTDVGAVVRRWWSQRIRQADKTIRRWKEGRKLANDA